MKSSTIITLGILISIVVLTPVKSDKTQDYFDQWRPNFTGAGCHIDGVENTQVPGMVLFNPSNIVVDAGSSFSFNLSVADFGGNLNGSSNDVSIGLNILDGNNSDFMTISTSQVAHKVNVDGNSVDAFNVTLVAPSIAGNYTLIAYAIAGSNTYFNWVTGQTVVTVVGTGNPKPPSFTVASSEPANDEVIFTFDFAGATNIEKVEMSINQSTFELISLVNNEYVLDITSYNLGYYQVDFNVTNSFNLTSIQSTSFRIEAPLTASDDSSTSISDTSVTSTPIDTTPLTNETKEETSLLASGVSVSILTVIFIGIVAVPFIFKNKF